MQSILPLQAAADKYNIDLSQSWMVGDGLNDVEAGIAAGCRVAYIGKNAPESTCRFEIFENLLDCVRTILQM